MILLNIYNVTSDSMNWILQELVKRKKPEEGKPDEYWARATFHTSFEDVLKAVHDRRLKGNVEISADEAMSFARLLETVQTERSLLSDDVKEAKRPVKAALRRLGRRKEVDGGDND